VNYVQGKRESFMVSGGGGGGVTSKLPTWTWDTLRMWRRALTEGKLSIVTNAPKVVVLLTCPQARSPICSHE